MPTSETEAPRPNNSEEPVREKLEETTISPTRNFAASPPETIAPVQDNLVNDNGNGAAQQATENGFAVGPASKKRGLDEDAEIKPAEKHVRKVSRDQAVENAGGNPQEDAMDEDQPVEAKQKEPTETEKEDEDVPVDMAPEQDVNGSASQPCTPPPADEPAGDANRDSVSSPKNKRRHEQMDRDHQPGIVQVVNRDAESDVQLDGRTHVERAVKRQKSQSPDPMHKPRDSIDEAAKPTETPAKIPSTSGFENTSAVSGFAALAKAAPPQSTAGDAATKHAGIPTTSGFANASAISPFGALAGSKSPTLQAATSSSAFASSGFGGFAASSASPFSAIGKPAASSPFGTIGSSGGFGALASKGETNSSVFAGGSGPKILGLSEKPVKPFGAADEDDDDEEGEAEGDEGTEDDTDNGDKSDEQKLRMSSVPLETGEENEMTVYTCRAKLYAFISEGSEKKEWKERGLGTLKVNAPSPDDDDGGPARKRARILMRADGSHRLLLNSPIQKGTVSGEKPKGSNMLFLGVLPGETQLQTLQLRIRPQFLGELWKHISDLQKSA